MPSDLATPNCCGSSPRMRGTVRPRPCRRARGRFIPAHAGNRKFAATATQILPVHPRACGEQGRKRTTDRGYIGSSPRMRGTGRNSHIHSVSFRFIPAHAGNRTPGAPPEKPFAVHPRACGEQKYRPSDWFWSGGSSPRMRGTGAARPRREHTFRFIPAHAGNSKQRGKEIHDGLVHPRACGEQGNVHRDTASHIGSSPRMRGTDGR